MNRFGVALAAVLTLMTVVPAAADGFQTRGFVFGRGGHTAFLFDPLHFGGVPFVARVGPFAGHRARISPFFFDRRIPSDRFLGPRYRGYAWDYPAGYVGFLATDLALERALSQPTPAGAPLSRTMPPGCRRTTTLGHQDGRLAEFGAIMCPDDWGKQTVVPGTEYFLRYME